MLIWTIPNLHCHMRLCCVSNPPKFKVTASLHCLSSFLRPSPPLRYRPSPPLPPNNGDASPMALATITASSTAKFIRFFRLRVAGIIGHIWDLCGLVSGSISVLRSGKWGSPVSSYGCAIFMPTFSSSIAHSALASSAIRCICIFAFRCRLSGNKILSAESTTSNLLMLITISSIVISVLWGSH